MALFQRALIVLECLEIKTRDERIVCKCSRWSFWVVSGRKIKTGFFLVAVQWQLTGTAPHPLFYFLLRQSGKTDYLVHFTFCHWTWSRDTEVLSKFHLSWRGSFIFSCFPKELRPLNPLTAQDKIDWTKKTSKSWILLTVWPLKWKLSMRTF